MENLVADSSSNPLAGDLDHVLTHTRALWEPLRGTRVFVTGGTGFFGCWLLESLLWANDRLALQSTVTVLTRDADGFRRRAPHLAHHPAVTLHHGEVESFAFPYGRFSHIVHAATAASATLNATDPVSMFETIVLGTRRTLEFARRCGAARVLLTSSGAVYGPQPPDLTHISEEYPGRFDPADSRAAYAEGKRAAETLCAAYAEQHGVQTTVARCFAFVGPYLPLDAHFAAGNFIGNALRGEPIHVQGDGTPFRSYLYAADLAIWLWTILIRGIVMRPYNVGSDNDVTIEELAHAVAQCVDPPVPVIVSRPAAAGAPAQRYVPAVARAQTELGLQPHVSLHDSIARTIAWHRHRSTHPRVTP